MTRSGGAVVTFTGQAASTNQTINGFFIIYEKTDNGSNYEYKSRYENPEIIKTNVNLLLSPNGGVFRRNTFRRTSLVNQTDVDSLIDFRYVRTDDILSVVTSDEFRVVQINNQNAFTLVDQLSTSTKPSIAEYSAITMQNTFINGEPESSRRWMGNIWEFATRRVRAQ